MTKSDAFLRELITSIRSAARQQAEKPTALSVNQRLEDLVKSSIDLENRHTDPVRVADDDLLRLRTLLSVPKMSQSQLDEGDSFGDPYLYQVFKPMIQRACDIARSKGLLAKPMGTIGILPLGTPNAMAIAVPDSDEHIVVFQLGLPLFLNRVAKLVLSVESAIPVDKFEALNKYGEDGWQAEFLELVDDAISANPALQVRFLELLVATLIVGDPNAASPHRTAATESMIRVGLLYHMEMFIIGHEIGHIAAGRWSKDSKRMALPVGPPGTDLLISSQASEIEADIIGYAICDTSVSQFEETAGTGAASHYYFAGPDLFFTCASILEGFMKLLGEGWAAADTHPSAEFRRTLRREFLQSVNARGAVVTGQRLQIIVDELANRIRPQFQEIVLAGNSISPSWKVCP